MREAREEHDQEVGVVRLLQAIKVPARHVYNILGRQISMPRVTQLPSVTVEAHALRHLTSARRVASKY